MTRNSAIDIVKFILALVVAAIHINPVATYGYLRFPLARVAVPLFFMISSYFFFKKCEYNSGKNSFKGFAIRNIKLYFSWFVLLFPLTIYIRKYFAGGLLRGLKKMLLSVMFASSFPASWYISALVIGVAIVYYLGKSLNNEILLFIGFILYSVCCLMSNYGEVFAKEGILAIIGENYPGVVYNSFPVGIIWIVLGKIVAERKDVKQKVNLNSIYFVVCIILLIGEQILIIKLESEYTNDCYFMLIPVCYLVFNKLVSVECEIPGTCILQVLSTVIYCMHMSLGMILQKMFEWVGIDYKESILGALGLYCVVILLCIICALTMHKLAQIDKLRWISKFY